MAKDFFDFADDFFDDIVAKIDSGFRHYSGSHDLDHAWSELDEFDRRMEGLGHTPKPDGRTFKEHDDTYKKTESTKNAPSSPADEKILQLARDYQNLELEPGSDETAVKTAYKKMLMRYHPDRFASDPEKQATATQITIKLNESFDRISEYLVRRQKT